MKRSTIVMLTLFAVLLGAWLWSQRTPTHDGPPPLAVQGYVEGVSLQDIRILNKDEESPYTRFTIERQGEKVVLELLPGQEKVKPGERKWSAVRTAGDEQLKTHGQAYRVRLYNQVLALSFRSSYSFEAEPTELAEYGLDDAQAVTFTAEGGGRKVSLRLGKVLKTGEGDTDASTWVMNPEVPKVVYRVAGRDLRTELAVPWKDIRERKLFEWNLAEIDRIELSNPKDTKAAKVVMTRPALTAEQRKKMEEALAAKGDEKDQKDKKEAQVRKPSEGWLIAEPTGYPPGDIGDWLESLERMQATDYRPFKDGKLPENTGLETGKGVRISVGTGDKLQTLIIGAKSDNKEGDVWVQVEGRNELYLVASWSTDQCIKKLDSLRDLRMLGELKSSSSPVFSLQSPEGSMTASRKDGKWYSKDMELDSSKIDSFLGDIDGVRVEYDSGKTRAAVGLEPPAYTYTVDVGGKPLRLLVSLKQGEDTWGAVNDGDVFKLQSWNADRLRKKPSDFSDKHLVDFQTGEVRALRIRKEGGELESYAHQPDGGWALVGDDKATLKKERIDALITTLTEVSYEQKEKGANPAENGLAKGFHSIEIELPPNRQVQIRVAADEKDGQAWAAVYRSGKLVSIGRITAMNATSLKKSLVDFK